MASSETDNHSRTIVHVDVDCFYAQVEVNKNPDLANKPLGIQQKNIVVTSNYKAREYGIKKCMLIADARKLCPELVLVNGEDLHDYRQVSYKVTNLLQQNFSHLVERLGLDENFIDVTHLVKKRGEEKDLKLMGHIFGDISEKCDCGCYENLVAGSVIAKEIRDLIKIELNLTTCAGIAHNKVLAKIVGSQNKPNQQTVIFPHSAVELMLTLKLADIPGIGRVMNEQLEQISLTTVADFHKWLDDGHSMKILDDLLGSDKARLVNNLCYGIDVSGVKTTGKPQSIGLEDSCRSISMENDVKDKLQQLLTRLLLLVSEDGRTPKTIKLTVRKFDKHTKTANRETRQCNLNFPIKSHNVNNESKIMSTVMHLFNRIVDPKKPYHITLLGLAFTKFQEAPSSKNSIASFLIRKDKDLEVQSLTSIDINPINKEAKLEQPIPSTSNGLSSAASLGLKDSLSPSPKKLKLTGLNNNNITSSGAKKRCFEENYEECASPSKLRVADLSLDPSVPCPGDVDPDVFKELPWDVQKELWEEFKARREKEFSFCGRQIKKAKPNTLLNYFVKNNQV